jgi:SAM-dependent methyltransferase
VTQQQRHLVCAPNPRVVTGGGNVWLFGPAPNDGCALDGDSAQLVLAVLEHAREPIEQEALVAAVARTAGADLSQRHAIDQAVSLLVRMGALVQAVDAPEAHAARVSGRVVHAVCGAVGSAHSPQLVQLLLRAGHEVRVAMTRSARRFVARRVLEALTHRRVETNMWEGSPASPAPHVELARWADVVVVCLCTATTLSRLAAADCSELVSAVATTTRAPVLVVPSMNAGMLEAPTVERNLESLHAAWFFVAHPGVGQEVADAPPERVLRRSVAASFADVVRYTEFLLERAAAGEPRLPTRADWNLEHERLPDSCSDAPLDPDIAAALERHAPSPSRVLDVGTGSGHVARGAALRGHTVVATDFSETAIRRAQAVAPEAPVTWLVDDATQSGVHAIFDVCIDRGSFGCTPLARRSRYLDQVARWLRPAGVWLLKVHRPPATLRAYAFEVEEMRDMTAPSFDLLAVHPSSMRYGLSEQQSWTFELRRRQGTLIATGQ